MVKYLQFDGVDDYMTSPPMSFTEVYMEYSFKPNVNLPTISIAAENGQFAFVRFPHGFYEEGVLDASPNGDAYLNGVKQVNMTNYMPIDRKVTVRIVTATIQHSDISFMSMHMDGYHTEGKVWNIKIFNGSALQAHYDLTTGDAKDKSGNSRHATVVGAVFVVDETVPTLGAPSVAIISQTRTKLSPIPPSDKSALRFKFDQDITDWAVMVLGSDYSTGTIAGSGKAVAKDAEVLIEITYQMLYQEGGNRINIYGKSLSGQWSIYET